MEEKKMNKKTATIASILLGMLVFATASTAIAETLNDNQINGENHNALGPGATHYVGGSGPENYSKIQDAIDNASMGDTVFVFDDSSPYDEKIFINETITLLGEGQETTVINYTGNSYDPIVTINADDVELNGFTIMNYGDAAVRITANNTIVTNVKIKPNINGWSGYGITLYREQNTHVFNTEITRTFTAIQILDSSNNTIENNVINDSLDDGIYIFGSYNIVRNNVIIGNNDEYTKPIGISLDGTGNIIANNTITAVVGNAVIGISLWTSTNNIIEDNILEKTGFECYKSEINVFSDNTVNGKPFVFLVSESNKIIDDAGQVILVNCTDITVEHLMISNVNIGIKLVGTQNSIVRSNILSNCWDGISLESSLNNIITDNTLSKNAFGVDDYNGRSNIIEKNTISDGDYYGISMSSSKGTIRKNLIQNCSIGVDITLFRNTVEYNTIRNCFKGIFLQGAFLNTIAHNNFMGNDKDASFYTIYFNRWVKNYWERPLLFPKIINGKLLLYENYWERGGYSIEIPWVNIDRHPALIPNDIS